MEQLNLFDMDSPFKYIIDTSSILSQKDNEPHRRKLYKGKWENIDNLIKKKVIITCSEVKDEILLDDIILKWMLSLQCKVVDIDDIIQRYVIKIVTEHPKLIEFKKIKSSGDAFLIATAMKYDLTVISEENKKKHNNIPYICNALGISCINILELCIVEGWQF